MEDLVAIAKVWKRTDVMRVALSKLAGAVGAQTTAIANGSQMASNT